MSNDPQLQDIAFSVSFGNNENKIDGCLPRTNQQVTKNGLFIALSQKRDYKRRAYTVGPG